MGVVSLNKLEQSREHSDPACFLGSNYCDTSNIYLTEIHRPHIKSSHSLHPRWRIGIRSPNARNSPRTTSLPTKSSPSFPGFSWSSLEPIIPSLARRIAGTNISATQYGDKTAIDGHLSA